MTNMTDRINQTLRKLPTWPIYVAGAAWAAWLFWLGLTGGLGVEPINALERAYGEVALILLVAGLAVTPLRKWFGINLIRFRRAIGLTAFFFVVAHLLVFALLDVQTWARVWEEVLKRPYVTVGMAAFLLLVPLALTSNNLSIRKLGPRWRSLHKLTYVATVLGGVHYLWLVKGFPYEPLIYLAVIGLLLLARVRWQRRRQARTSAA